ncbi:hypothetical protein K439DRAFT_1340407 [Ramaria rubella]|nr:hypothetical protein K439DRAFT_1340407 [Ramaria rubella]
MSFLTAGKTIDVSLAVRHSSYYFRDGVIFLVEGFLFKIPRYQLERNSPFFEGMFSLPNGPEDSDGLTDEKPIHIPQVLSIDFERLLALLYPLTLDYATYTDTWKRDEWLSILNLASMWEITRARELAIEELEKCLSPFEKIIFGRKYDHVFWVQKGFTHLCLREEYLTSAEANQMSKEDIRNYGKVREVIRACVMTPKDRSTGGTWTKLRHGSTYVRNGGYEDGMLHLNSELIILGIMCDAATVIDPMIRELIEDHIIGNSQLQEAAN